MSSLRVGSDLLAQNRLSETDIKRRFGENAAEKAADLYRMWHQKHPEGFGAADYDEPESFVRVGRVTHGVYFSDKWEEDGRGYLYEHVFDSEPTLFVDDVLASCLISSDRKLRQYPCTAARDVLKWSKDYNLVLAFISLFVKITFKDGKDVVGLDFSSENAPTFCLPDKKGIVVFVGDEDPACLVIRGGSMKVTERGILY